MRRAAAMAHKGAEWIEGMRGVRVLDVAQALGLAELGPKTPSAWCLSPCPACGAERRHTKSGKNGDKRGAVGVAKAKPAGWHCYQCEASGDALDLVAFRLRGHRLADLHDNGKAEVREWCMRWLGLDTSPTSSPRPLPLARPTPPPAPEPEPVYPPAAEVAALWAACVRVDDDAEAAAWLREVRHVDPTRIADADVARVLPSDASTPSWATLGGRPWTATRHRLVVPMVDARGVVRSVLARRVPNPTAEGDLKSTAPKGYQRAGLVMACPLARQLLEHGARPEWWPAGAELRVIVAEGETDWLAWITASSDANETAPAVLGMVSGSWTPAIAARAPDGAVVLVATDNDAEGDKYAARVLETLAERMRAGKMKLERWRP